jgi:hypothetical protein
LSPQTLESKTSKNYKLFFLIIKRCSVSGMRPKNVAFITKLR